MPNSTPDGLLTAEELAEALHVHPETVGRWSRAGEIPYIELPGGKVRKHRRYNLAEVRAARDSAARCVERSA